MRRLTAVLIFILCGCAPTRGAVRWEGMNCTITFTPSTPRDYLCNAKVLDANGLYEEAVRVLLAGMRKYGERREFLFCLSRVLEHAGIRDLAEKYRKRAERDETADFHRR